MGRAPGLYALAPCFDVFYDCTTGLPGVQRCPQGTTFNEGAQQCIVDRACFPVVEPPRPQPPIFVPPIITFCTNREDGLYAMTRCSASFYICLGGQETIQQCKSGTTFSEVTGQCMVDPACQPPLPALPTLPPVFIPPFVPAQPTQQPGGKCRNEEMWR